MTSSTDLLNLYSEWEEGRLSTLEFTERAQALSYSNSDACYHRSLAGGRWFQPGHCGADVRFVALEAFPIAPSLLLQKLGIVPIPKDISMIHLLLGATAFGADETIFANWPK